MRRPRLDLLTVSPFAVVAAAALAWACGDTSEIVDVTEPTMAEVHVSPAPIATEPNLKVAFIGDTGTGADFRRVLQLIKREGADLVMVQGDLNYSFGGSAGPWFSVADAELAGEIPYFLAKGNHDTDWRSFGSGMASRLQSLGLTPSGDPVSANYAVDYKGLAVVMVSDSETSPSRADFIKQRFQNDNHAWRICSWHKNQRASNIGPKNDEMGWAVYENCRAAGAIVAQGHSHTYSRSRTLTNDAAQTVDPTCKDPFDLCVGGGRHFFFDSSVGGQDLRGPTTSVASKPYWGGTFTGAFGALFIEFNVDGDPNRARGYFKTTDDRIVDPPPSSGRSSFSIFRTP